MWSVNAPTALSRCYATGKRNFFCSLSRHQSTYCFILNRVTKMKNPIELPVSQAKEGRKTLALENYLIRFFERELEVKLTRREMWRSVRFVASLFVLLFALATGEPLLALPALALAAYAYRGVAGITARFSAEKGGER